MPKKSKTIQLSDISDKIAQPKKFMDMNSSVLTQIHFLGNKVQYSGSAGYRKWFDIGISEFRLLGVISNEPGSTGARISELMGLNIAAISRTLNNMLEKGLVIYAAHEKHPSYKCWYVTKEGAELHDKVLDMTSVRETAILKDFNQTEKFQLLSFLHRLSQNADELRNIADNGQSSND